MSFFIALGIVLFIVLVAFLISLFFYSKNKKHLYKRIFSYHNESIIIGGKHGMGKKVLLYDIIKQYSKNEQSTKIKKYEFKSKYKNVYSNLDKSWFEGLNLNYHHINEYNWENDGSNFDNDSFIVINEFTNTLNKFSDDLKQKGYEKNIEALFLWNDFRTKNQKVIVTESSNWLNTNQKYLNQFNLYLYIWDVHNKSLFSNKKIKRIKINLHAFDYLENYSKSIQKDPKQIELLNKKSFLSSEQYLFNLWTNNRYNENINNVVQIQEKKTP